MTCKGDDLLKRSCRMTRVVVLALIFAGNLRVEHAAALSIAYDQKLTAAGQVTMSKVRAKNKLFRAESIIQGMSSIIIRNERGTFNYLPEQHIAIKLPMLGASPDPAQGSDDYQAYLNAHQAQRLGSETVNGYACDIYQFTDPANGGMTKAWVWKAKQFPVKLELHGPQGLNVAEFSHIQFDVSIPDSAFQLPSGVKVMEMGDVMNPDALKDLLQGSK